MRGRGGGVGQVDAGSRTGSAPRFARAGCRYHQAPSLLLAGDPGAAVALADLGAVYEH